MQAGREPKATDFGAAVSTTDPMGLGARRLGRRDDSSGDSVAAAAAVGIGADPFAFVLAETTAGIAVFRGV